MTVPRARRSASPRRANSVEGVAHPRMYSDDDPFLTEIREICLAFPEAIEKEAWGRPTFRAGKMFAVFAGDDDHRFTLEFKPDPEDRDALIQDARVFVPPYSGASGWLALDLAAAPVDWDEIRELVESSYRLIALKRMLKDLDART
ncbi:MAG: MmcQ/YjbR family DNA-binding protein [Acidimicrobiia bacterium]|nr:MmcQ/YjbR family DNA-binding protein [Acidimicrobiia bacterium]